MGVDIRLYQLNELGNGFPMGQMNFDNLFTAGFTDGSLDPSTGNPIASFLLGLPSSYEHDIEFAGQVSGRRWKQYRPYFQDSWKMRKNLTVQLGLAWNYATPTSEVLNRMSNFDFATGKLLIAGVNSNKWVGIKPYYANYEPRLGISYSTPSGQTVIHLGYAILHDTGWSLGAEGLDLNPPFFGSQADQSDDITPITTLSQGFPPPTPPDVNNLSGNIYSQNTDFKPGMVQQYNLTVQNQLPDETVFTLGYMGSRSSHLLTGIWNLNTAPPNPQIDPPNLRPYPQFNQVWGIIDRGMSSYNSLQAKLEKGNRNGLYFLLSYTWAKGFDNGLLDDLGSLVGAAYYPLQPPPGTSDKGLSITNQTNNFSGSVLYQLPFGRGTRFASSAGGLKEAVIGHWQLNVIAHLASGFPVGLITGVNNSGTSLPNGNRPNQICNGTLKNHSVAEFFNTNCFVDPPAAQLGNASRTPLNGPDFVNFDSSLFKNFDLPEKAQLQFRTEVFNVANHPQFANPGNFTDSPGFGQITQIVNNPRLIQFALKLIF